MFQRCLRLLYASRVGIQGRLSTLNDIIFNFSLFFRRVAKKAENFSIVLIVRFIVRVITLFKRSTFSMYSSNKLTMQIVMNYC